MLVCRCQGRARIRIQTLEAGSGPTRPRSVPMRRVLADGTQVITSAILAPSLGKARKGGIHRGRSGPKEPVPSRVARPLLSFCPPAMPRQGPDSDSDSDAGTCPKAWIPSYAQSSGR